MRKIGKLSVCLVTIFIGIELSLKLLGYVPYILPAPEAVQFFEPDNQKDWIHVSGKYEFSVNTLGDTMHLMINEHRERVTKPAPIQESSEEILPIGGSFMMGVGLDEEQTVAWKLQERFPSVNFRNLAVGAYCTYQSLLVLENQLRHKNKIKGVTYGLIDHHRLRNVSEPDWLNLLTINKKIKYKGHTALCVFSI